MAISNPKPAFFLAVLVVVLGLVGLGLWRFGALPGTSGGTFSKEEMAKQVESPDAQGITTAKQYNYVPAQKLPAVQGISSYKPMTDRTVRFAMNVCRLSSRITDSSRAKYGRVQAARTSKSS
jgi:hypothetical protein